MGFSIGYDTFLLFKRFSYTCSCLGLAYGAEHIRIDAARGFVLVKWYYCFNHVAIVIKSTSRKHGLVVIFVPPECK